MRTTLDDKLAQDGLRAVSEVARDHDYEVDFVLVGGMATQAFNSQPSLYRPTSDADILPTRNMPRGMLKREYGLPIVELLEEKGYDSHVNKCKDGVEISIRDGDTPEDLFFLHIMSYTPNYWERNAYWIGKELDNRVHRDISTDGKPLPFSVIRTEDIIASKMRRLWRLMLYSDNREMVAPVYTGLKAGNFDMLQDYATAERLDMLNQRKAFILDTVNKENLPQFNSTLQEFKARKDIYDIAILLEEVRKGNLPFDQDYFRESASYVGLELIPSPVPVIDTA